MTRSGNRKTLAFRPGTRISPKSSRPTGAISDVGLALKSRRDTLLSLETLYGDGPDGTPNAYAPAPPGSMTRNAFALSRASIKGAEPGGCPFRDIGRAQPHGVEADTSAGFLAALVADPRNDVHAVAAQLIQIVAFSITVMSP